MKQEQTKKLAEKIVNEFDAELRAKGYEGIAPLERVIIGSFLVYLCEKHQEILDLLTKLYGGE